MHSRHHHTATIDHDRDDASRDAVWRSPIRRNRRGGSGGSGGGDIDRRFRSMLIARALNFAGKKGAYLRARVARRISAGEYR